MIGEPDITKWWKVMRDINFEPQRMTTKEVSKTMKIVGAIGGIVVGALVGALALAVPIGLAEIGYVIGSFPSPWLGALAGGAVGLALGLFFPEKLAYAFAWVVAQL